ncbi:MAG: hypothetical protein KatS3mg095_0416 [Candidatus Parcubacteria bacterium]|nr:MAG: hypothetical protein KatS3mg095_0416 [Candidatus Parcubacteria bacterium]
MIKVLLTVEVKFIGCYLIDRLIEEPRHTLGDNFLARKLLGWKTKN